MTESRLLNAQVRRDELQFLFEPYPLDLRSPQCISKYLRKFLDRLVCGFRLIVNQTGDCAQRIEQKMRIDLRSQRSQFRTAREKPKLQLFTPKTDVFQDGGERPQKRTKKN